MNAPSRQDVLRQMKYLSLEKLSGWGPMQNIASCWTLGLTFVQRRPTQTRAADTCSIFLGFVDAHKVNSNTVNKWNVSKILQSGDTEACSSFRVGFASFTKIVTIVQFML